MTTRRSVCPQTLRFVAGNGVGLDERKLRLRRLDLQRRRDRDCFHFVSIAPPHQHGCSGDDDADCRCAGGWLRLRARLHADQRCQRGVFW